MTYSTDHWIPRIAQYQSEAWSQQPTPFARLVLEYLPAHGRILELGAGAGQDSLWFASRGFAVVLTDAIDTGFPVIQARAQDKKLKIDTQKLDLTRKFKFEDKSFDVVYAQLVLHYFTDEVMTAIMEEIGRVLKPGGILACMVNSIKDPEYNAAKLNAENLITVGLLDKRYFSQATFAPFMQSFQTILFNDQGKTPKDDAVSNSGMIQFIGKKPA